jgi:hypothetical protein
MRVFAKPDGVAELRFRPSADADGRGERDIGPVETSGIVSVTGRARCLGPDGGALGDVTDARATRSTTLLVAIHEPSCQFSELRGFLQGQ